MDCKAAVVSGVLVADAAAVVSSSYQTPSTPEKVFVNQEMHKILFNPQKRSSHL